MFAARSGPAFRRVRAVVVSLALAATAAGCASAGGALPSRPAPGTLAPGSPLLSRSLSEGDAWLRHFVMSEDYTGALDLLRRSSARPGDRLLRSLQEGVVLHHAGRHAESNRALEWAEQEADRRYTRSVSRGVGSLVVNDRVLAYTPSAGEMAIIPYYRMLNYLALGRVDDAAVEARKSSAYLARVGQRGGDACMGFGLVQFLAGQVFAAAGERNDALVSFRQAERSFDACDAPGAPRPAGLGADLFHAARALGLQDIADSARARYALDDAAAGEAEGDVIIFLEHGFAAHRVQQDLFVPLLESDVNGTDGSNGSALAAAGRISTQVAAALLVGAEAHHLWDDRRWTLTPDLYGRDGVRPYTAADVAYMLRLAWPVMRLEASRPLAARVVVGDAAFDAPPLEDVSARLVRDLESRRGTILSRMVARGVVKFVATREAEEYAEKKGGELLGALAGFVTNAAGAALEQADTRSWTLLPDQISLARLRLPAGEHPVRIELTDARGMVNRIVDLGMVEVRPGERVILSRRVWGSDSGDRDRLVRLGIDTFARSEIPPPMLEASPGPRVRQRQRPPRRPSPVGDVPDPRAVPRPAEVPPAPPPPVRLPGT